MSHAVSIELEDNRGTVTGYCDPMFESVLEAFVTNFHDREEQGASVCINVEGETLVDLWGGRRHPKQGDDWQADTLTVVHSVTKAAVALCAHVLIAEGRLDPHAPVIDYWPEFGQAGKSGVTVSMLLNHSAGLAALRQPLKPGAYLDWDYMVAALAAETPFWEPGTRNGYHMSTFGWTVGEVVRRVSGQSLGEFFRDRIAGPLQLDFHIGLPDEEHHRVSRVLRWTPKKNDPVSPFTHALLADRDSLQYLALLNSGGFKTDAPESYRAEFGGGGGIASARGIAGMFNPLANGGGDLVDKVTLARMGAVSAATMNDVTLVMPTCFSPGFMLSMDNRWRPTGELETIILGQHAFGHAGAGGSVGFADTACHMGFGYAMNRMGAGILLNPRGQSLVDAAYRSLGYTTCEPGFWIR